MEEHLDLHGKIFVEKTEVAIYIERALQKSESSLDELDLYTYRHSHTSRFNEIKNEAQQYITNCVQIIDNICAAFEQNETPIPDRKIGIYEWNPPMSRPKNYPAMLEWSLDKAATLNFSQNQVKTSLSEWCTIALNSYCDISDICLNDNAKLSNKKWVSNMEEFYTQLERCMDNFYHGLNGYMDILKETATVLEMSEK
jgi:hypothetical protein